MRRTFTLADTAAWDWPLGQNGLDPRGTNLIYGWITPETIPLIDRLGAWWQPVVVLRDPLATLLSVHGRRALMTHGMVMEGWHWVVDRIKPEQTVPVDLGPASRKALVERLVSKGQLQWARDASERGKAWAAEWPVKRFTSGLYSEARQAYILGDKQLLDAKAGRELALLAEAESWLRPWLEHCGYRDLIWFSGPKTPAEAA